MYRIVTARIAQALPVMLIVAILTFLLMHMLPGDPAVIIAGDQAGPEAIAAVRHSLGLDRPVPEQLWRWLTHLAQGNFGDSLILNQPVLQAVAERLPVTLSLAAVAFAITVPVGVALGIVAAYWRNSWLDSAVMGFALVGVSVPSFWVATLSVILFSVNLGWLPSAGYVPMSDGFGAWLAALIQPAVVLALFQIGFLARMTRSEMLEILDQDFVRTARAKGVSEFRTVGKHAFRNTLVSVVTVGGYILSLLIGGSVVVEQVFALPGIGRLLVQAILARDYPTVQGTMLLLGFAFVLINVLIDIVYTFIDPRVRYD
ncbi:peptide ABC transporter [Achromobacter sp. DMS1]|uniref:ABC transporter permease n=1 Tax=Achromobacter sp. DMS1 TaxID=1688405 RepID=UPI00069FA3B6|nr:ABC transporter permease [Achromobacter sp. DMS1]KOF55424.1 peptide ABC transporter [Achromobacter sp. DMS1]